MNHIKKIAIERVYIKRIAKFTESLRILANTNRIKYMHMLQNFRAIRNHTQSCTQNHDVDSNASLLGNMRGYIQNCSSSPLDTRGNDRDRVDIANEHVQKVVHLIIGCDQKFCKSFVKNMAHILERVDFTNADHVIVIGKQLLHVMKQKVAPDTLKTMNMPQSIDDATYIACELYGYRAYVHSYVDEKYECSVLEFTNGAYIHDEITRVGSDIYMYCLESQLFENIERSEAMFEAAEHSKDKAQKLLNQYNKLRQSEITTQVLAQR